MLNIIRRFYALSLLMSILWLLAGLTSCSAGPQEPDQPGRTVTTTIYGQVVDEAGTPVSGVAVTSSSSMATTDSRGLFILKNVVVSETRLVVTAKKTGYFPAARAEEPRAGGATRTKLFMMSNAPTYSVSASSGGAVNITGGASIQFQASSFQTSSGAPYSGTVNIAARYLDPANSTFGDFFSGDNLAQTTDGSEAALISCGVLRVEMSGQNGETLKLDASKPATISYPKPPSNTAAPSTMPLWYYDETLGMWKEEGSATLQGTKYVGTVTHFTDWNLDYKGDYGTLELRVVCNGIPIEGVAIKFAGFDHKTGYTDQQGKATFVRVPADKEVEIFIRASDNNGLYFINGSVKKQIVAGQTTDIGDIILNSPCPAGVTGTLTDCNDAITDGLVLLEWTGGVSYTYTTNGTFILKAGVGVPLTLNATRADGNEGIPVDILPLTEGQQYAAGNIKVCGTGSAAPLDIPLASMKSGSTVVLSDDGTKVALCTPYPAQIDIYDAANGTLLNTITIGNQEYLYDARLNADGSKLLTITWQTARLYDLSAQAGTVLWSLSPIQTAYFASDGQNVLVSYGDYNVAPAFQLYAIASGLLFKDVTPPSVPVRSALYGPLSSTELAWKSNSAPDEVRIWDYNANTETKFAISTSGSFCRGLSLDAVLFAEATYDSKLHLYNVATRQLLSEFTINKSALYGRDSGVVSLRGLTQNLFADRLSDQNGSGIRLLKTSDGSLMSMKVIPGIGGKNATIYDVALSKNEQFLAAVTTDKIRIWKLK